MSSQSKIRKQISKRLTRNAETGCEIKDSSIFTRTKWTLEEDKKLMANVSLFGHRWLRVAQMMEQRNASQCCQRWKRIRLCQGFQLNKAKRWTKEEDETLLKIYKELGPSWNEIAERMKIKSGKQVRRRFKNVLDPNLNHGPITEVEDELIYQEYLKCGSQWSKISEKLHGRSENMIKNRFYSYLKQKYLNKPNLYFKVKPFDEMEKVQNQVNFQEEQNIQITDEQQIQYDWDFNKNSNEVVEDNQSSQYWSVETRGYILQSLK
ncbi:unnamed protein product [Paramecium octaurelia]|uniref:Myb-like DNA-binding domain containing protein n=1 Tax=Paramecium octaurelia TaxID=43137 RepID=A0A8S1XJY7_PAROT|nr:unnamed protein product [Paramecium octaurelia]